jgi:predicted nucleic acid-binding protein
VSWPPPAEGSRLSEVVVADAGPLIGLARIDRLSLLTALYGPVVIPESVRAELGLAGDRPGAKVLSAALASGAIQTRALAQGHEAALAGLRLLLDAGESAAILLAEETGCRFLLIDERRGREIARRRGIPVVGLAGVLLAAKRFSLLESVGPVLADLSQQGYRFAGGLVAEVLRLAGETRQPGD